MIDIEKIMPIWKIEHRALVSMNGDKTIVFKVGLPETGTLGASGFDTQHQAWVKGMRLLPSGTILHKTDWFTKAKVKADFAKAQESTLAMASERFFNERPYLDHECYLFLTLTPVGRKLSSSAYANILRKSIAPVEAEDERRYKNFLAACGQFERILTDTGMITLQRLGDEELAGTANKPGIIEKYCFLLAPGQQPMIRDIHVKDGLRVGDQHCELYTLIGCGGPANALLRFSRNIDHDAYSTDRSKYSIGFASPLGQLLDCNHIYSQYIFIGDAQQTIKQLEAKKLRLQSLSAYSRENALASGCLP